MIMHLTSENLYKRAMQEIATTCPKYLCSICFLMCQWRQWLPNNFDWLWSYCATSSAAGVSLLLRWVWKCRVLCRLPPPKSSVCHWGITWLPLLHKRPICPSCSLPVYVSFLHQAPRPFRAERDACVWASVSPLPPFRKQREKRRVLTHIPPAATPKEICPSSHASVRLGECTHHYVHTAVMITIRQQLRLC